MAEKRHFFSLCDSSNCDHSGKRDGRTYGDGEAFGGSVAGALYCSLCSVILSDGI